MAEKILVTGSKGQLGSELQLLQKKYPHYEFHFHDMDTLPLEDKVLMEKFFSTHKPNYCINAAAYTAVDKAETEKDLAYLVNATAVGYLAEICTKYNTKFLHVSTDYVFDGKSTSPYQADDKTNPQNVYGKSKLDGELLAKQYNPATIIIRTAWVYSSFGNNFVKTMLRLMKEIETLKVVNDQFGSPTYAADLADCILQIIASKKWEAGVYHYTNQGVISWYDFAKAIHESFENNCRLSPCTTAEYPTPAYRPKYSVLDGKKISNTFNIQLIDWKHSLAVCLKKLGN